MTNDKIIEMAKDLDFHYSQTANVIALARLIAEKVLTEAAEGYHYGNRDQVKTYLLKLSKEHSNG